MSKLKFANSAALVEGIYNSTGSDYILGSNLAANSNFYSLVFTADGYLYTHGLKFRIYKVINGQPDGMNLSWASDGKLQLTDGNTQIASVAVVGTLTGDSIISATQASGDDKAWTITHAKPNGLVWENTTYGNIGTLTQVKVPIITIDSYGHITTISNSGDLDVTKVKATAMTSSTSGTYYLVGVSGNTAQSPYYNALTNKAISINKNGELTAATFIEGGTSLVNKYAAKATATDSVEGTVLLSDATDGTENAASGGTAATPYAVAAALTAAKNHANDLFSQNDAMLFIGTIDNTGTFKSHNSSILSDVTDNTTKITQIAYKAGYTAKFTNAGTLTIGGVSFTVEAGDMLIAVNDKGDSVSGGDFTIVQNNISGALTSDTVLSGIVVANTQGRSLTSFAYPESGTKFLKATSSGLAWVDQSSLWRTFYKDSSGGTTISNKNIILKVDTGTGTSNPLELIFDSSSTPASITYRVHPAAIIGTASSLSITDGTTTFSYSPAAAATLNIGGGLSLTSTTASNVTTYTLAHPTSAQSTVSAKLGKITTDSYGHITAFTEVTSLKNPSKLYIGKTKTVATGSYDGSEAYGLTLTAGDDVSITASTKTAAQGLYSSGTTGVKGVDFAIGITHKYRPISIKSGNTVTDILANTSNSKFILKEGTHVSLTQGTGDNVNEVTITSSWRSVFAYWITNSTLSQGAFGDDTSLNFSTDFLWDSNEGIGLCWTEINGTVETPSITYAK